MRLCEAEASEREIMSMGLHKYCSIFAILTMIKVSGAFFLDVCAVSFRRVAPSAIHVSVVEEAGPRGVGLLLLAVSRAMVWSHGLYCFVLRGGTVLQVFPIMSCFNFWYRFLILCVDLTSPRVARCK
jgi:hypothetical protein